MVFAIGCMGKAAASSVEPPDKTVRVFYVLPSDVAFDSAYPKGIGKVMIASQKWYFQKCGFTFRLNNPICEVLKSPQPRSWFASVDDYSTIIFHGLDEVNRVYPAIKADTRRARWKIVSYVDAESPRCGGGAVPGWVGLPKHDADGAKGYPKDTARWCGGMCHELGHLWGLPDASGDDGTIMSAALYIWPNCTFPSNLVNSIKNNSANSGFWADEITGTIKDLYLDMTPEQWVPMIHGNQLHVLLPEKESFITAIVLYDLSGKRAALFSPATLAGTSASYSFPLDRLTAGSYVCAVKKGNTVIANKIVEKVK